MVESNPVRPVERFRPTKSITGRPATETRSDGDAVGEPGRPPAERPERDDGVVAQRRDGQVDVRRVAARVDDVLSTSDDVLPTPFRVVAEHDELDSTGKALLEVRQGRLK